MPVVINELEVVVSEAAGGGSSASEASAPPPPPSPMDLGDVLERRLRSALRVFAD